MLILALAKRQRASRNMTWCRPRASDPLPYMQDSRLARTSSGERSFLPKILRLQYQQPIGVNSFCKPDNYSSSDGKLSSWQKQQGWFSAVGTEPPSCWHANGRAPGNSAGPMPLGRGHETAGHEGMLPSVVRNKLAENIKVARHCRTRQKQILFNSVLRWSPAPESSSSRAFHQEWSCTEGGLSASIC